jgi:hypothetical protein
MALDARLADPLLLALAARRAKERQEAAPRQTVTLQVVYSDAFGHAPAVLYTGPTYQRVEGAGTWRLIPD